MNKRIDHITATLHDAIRDRSLTKEDLRDLMKLLEVEMRMLRNEMGPR